MNPCTGSCGQLERVFGRFTATPTEEERNPPPFRLTIARQLGNAHACVAHNLPSTGTTIGLSALAAVTLITLAAMLLRKSHQPGADHSDGAESRVAIGVATALSMAMLCVAACLCATVLHCLSDSPRVDAPGEDA